MFSDGDGMRFHKNGMTLVEVIVTLVIIAVLVALIAPYAVPRMASDSLRYSAGTVAAVAQKARQMAISACAIYAVRFVNTGPNDQYIVIYRFTAEDDNFKVAAGAGYQDCWSSPAHTVYDRYGADMTLTPNAAKAPLEKGVRFSPYAQPGSSVHSAVADYNNSSESLPDKTLPRNIAGKSGADGEWGQFSPLFFFPDGSASDNFSITLMDSENRYIRVAIGKLMADIQIEDVTSQGARE